MKKRTVGSKARSIALGGLVGLLGFLPLRSDADLISVYSNSGGGDVGGSQMFLRHEEEGKLGYDAGDSWNWGDSAPGMEDSPDWLRVYSDQLNEVWDTSGYELRRDNRPFSGEDTNKNFPLILDTQYKDTGTYGDPISSSNNLVRFELQSPIDTNRTHYHWTMTLDTNVASFVNSTNATKSGTWDLVATGGQDGTYDLPPYNLTNAKGQYATLDVLPSADSGETHTLTVISEHDDTTIGNPTGAGTYAHGHSATSSVDRVHAIAPGSRLRAIVPPRVEND